MLMTGEQVVNFAAHIIDESAGRSPKPPLLASPGRDILLIVQPYTGFEFRWRLAKGVTRDRGSGAGGD